MARIAKLSLLAKDNGVSLEEIKKHLIIPKEEFDSNFLDTPSS